MKPILLVHAIIGATLLSSSTIMLVASQRSEDSPDDTIKRFYEYSLSGDSLTPNGWNKITSLFERPSDPHPPTAGQPIDVIKGFIAKRNSVVGNEARFTVELRELGSVQPSLRFVRREGSQPYAPVRTQKFYSLIRDRERWKLRGGERVGRLGVDAAIQYVSAAAERADDAVTKMNARRTVETLRRLATGALAQPAIAVQKTPVKVVEEFCRMNADGHSLTKDGWNTMSPFFVEQGTPRRDKITIVRDFAVGNAEIADDDTASVTTEYLAVARLDSKTAMLEQGLIPPGGVNARDDFHLVLSSSRLPQDPPTWKIAGPLPEPRMTVEAAMMYVTALHDNTTDVRIKKNAERALVSLKRQLTRVH